VRTIVITAEQLEKYIKVIERGISHVTPDLEEALKDLRDESEVWKVAFKEVVKSHQLNADMQDLSQIGENYYEALKLKRLFLVRGTPNTYEMLTEQGIQTVISTAEQTWDWKGHEEYWPLEFHPESLFNEPIPHLKTVFFFEPNVSAFQIRSGRYKLFIRHGVDHNSNMLGQAELLVKAISMNAPQD